MPMKYLFLILMIMSALSCKSDVTGMSSEHSDDVVLEDVIHKTEGYNSATVSLKGVSSLILTGSSTQVLKDSKVNLCSNEAWLYLPNVTLKQFYEEGLSNNVLIDSKTAMVSKNVTLEKYYNGLLIKPLYAETYIPLYVYKENDGSQYKIELYKVYSSEDIPTGDNAVGSFFLKRGHMLVLAENSDGTGESKVYVATDNHMEVTLESNLKGKVSFLRVVPWNYITKKGIGGNFAKKDELKISWYYNWGLGGETTVSSDFVPMFWGNATQDGINQVLQKKQTNHVLSFNEPDGADQSNLTPAKAIERYPQLLKMGLRIGSPACTEGKWKTWLAEFMDGCKKNNYRVDFIAIHWYDWGNWLSTKDPDPQNIDAMVARFKKDIDDCYAKYGLPIWITEFNANKNRTPGTQIKFLEKALPMLEANPHVERYAYFQPFGGNGDFIVSDKITSVGQAYGTILSKPAYDAK